MCHPGRESGREREGHKTREGLCKKLIRSGGDESFLCGASSSRWVVNGWTHARTHALAGGRLRWLLAQVDRLSRRAG